MSWLTAVKRFCISITFGIIFSLLAHAADLKCDVCGMPISEHGCNLVTLSSSAAGDKPMHVCSPTCAHKLQKHAPQYSKAEVTDFNHTEKVLTGDKAYFLMQSSKIKSEMGPNVMAPYAAAFATKEEAEAAKAKYGDGVVVQGSDDAFKK